MTNYQVLGSDDQLFPETTTFEDRSREFDPARNVYGPWVRAAQLPNLFCSWDLAYRCTQSGWLTPILQGKRRTIYRLADVLRCLRRIEAGEMPPRRSRRNSE